MGDTRTLKRQSHPDAIDPNSAVLIIESRVLEQLDAWRNREVLRKLQTVEQLASCLAAQIARNVTPV